MFKEMYKPLRTGMKNMKLKRLNTLFSIDNFPSVSSVGPKEGKLSTISNSTKW